MDFHQKFRHAASREAGGQPACLKLGFIIHSKPRLFSLQLSLPENQNLECCCFEEKLTSTYQHIKSVEEFSTSVERVVLERDHNLYIRPIYGHKGNRGES